MSFVRLLLGFFLLLAAPAQAGKAAFGDWAAAVVAGDGYDSDGRPIAAFDNARRDIAAALAGAGFAAGNLHQFSTDPKEGVLPATPDALSKAWTEATARATAGCLLYVTSHGVPGRLVIGDRLMRPGDLDALLDATCANRPTVLVLSACYSGSFIPKLRAPNRLVLTAARADRSSFGCGTGFVYPVFDDCVLKALPTVPHFSALAVSARTCVLAREKRDRLAPPSQPQVALGEDMAKLIPSLSLRPD